MYNTVNYIKLDEVLFIYNNTSVYSQTLIDELIADNEQTCFQIAQLEEQLKKDELDKPSSKHAHHLACSILNMTSDDLDEFMKDNEKKVWCLYLLDKKSKFLSGLE